MRLLALICLLSVSSCGWQQSGHPWGSKVSVDPFTDTTIGIDYWQNSTDSDWSFADGDILDFKGIWLSRSCRSNPDTTFIALYWAEILGDDVDSVRIRIDDEPPFHMPVDIFTVDDQEVITSVHPWDAVRWHDSDSLVVGVSSRNKVQLVMTIPIAGIEDAEQHLEELSCNPQESHG